MPDIITPIVADVDLTDEQREEIFREAADARDANRTGIVTQRLDSHPSEDATDPSVAPVETAQTPPVAAPTLAATAAPTAPATPETGVIVKAKALEEMTTEELRAHSIRLEHERRAAVGRQQALQRELEASKRTPAPARPVVPEGEKLSSAFPELATSVQHEIESRLATERERIAGIQTQERLAMMEATFPGWASEMQGTDFNYWLSQQPASEQQKIHSDSVAVYATLLRGFHASQTPPTTAPAAGETEAQRIVAERTQRLTSSAAMPRGRPTVGGNTTGGPDPETDPDGYFDWLSKERERKRQAAPGARR